VTDFFTTEVWTWCGLVKYYIPFSIRLGTKGKVVLVLVANLCQRHDGPMRCRERLGGLLKYYYREVV